ncbi:MAG: hypothetical protein ACLP9L_27300 [Thermoguttaceae bacterium]
MDAQTDENPVNRATQNGKAKLQQVVVSVSLVVRCRPQVKEVDHNGVVKMGRGEILWVPGFG